MEEENENLEFHNEGIFNCDKEGDLDIPRY